HATNTVCSVAQCFIPRCFTKATALANDRPTQSIRIVVKILHADDLRAHVSAAHVIVAVAAHGDHAIALDAYDDPTCGFTNRTRGNVLHRACILSRTRAAFRGETQRIHSMRGSDDLHPTMAIHVRHQWGPLDSQ